MTLTPIDPGVKIESPRGRRKERTLTLDHDDETRLKIGAVSRLTGLSVHTVRKWEERYGAVTPIRTARGQRLYSREDVRRLALIRRLTQAGLPLNDIAGAPTSRLERTAGSMAPATEDALVPAAQLRSVRVVVVGDALPAQLDNAGHTASALRVVAPRILWPPPPRRSESWMPSC